MNSIKTGYPSTQINFNFNYHLHPHIEPVIFDQESHAIHPASNSIKMSLQRRDLFSEKGKKKLLFSQVKDKDEDKNELRREKHQ